MSCDQGMSRSLARARLSDRFRHQKLCERMQTLPGPFAVKHERTNGGKQLPDRPLQQIAADFAYHGGKEFLIVVDCKNDWPDIMKVGRYCLAEKLIEALRSQLCCTAVLWSDGGPQFTSVLSVDEL